MNLSIIQFVAAAASALVGQGSCNGGSYNGFQWNAPPPQPIVFEIRFAENVPFNYPSMGYSRGSTWSSHSSQNFNWSSPSWQRFPQRNGFQFNAGFNFAGPRMQAPRFTNPQNFYCPTCP